MPGPSSFRKLILNLHLWVGLGVAILMLLTGASGALLVFEAQIDQALNPKLSYVVPRGKPLSFVELQQSLERQYPGARVLGFGLSESDDISYGAYV